MPPTFILDEAEHVVPALSAALGLDSIIPLGHSVGGAMAIATAARWPERCGGVVTVSAHGFMEDRIGAGILAARAEFDRPGQFDRLARYHGDKARWVLDTWVDTWTSPDVADWSLDGVLRSLRCPALVLHGDRDEYGSLEQPSRIAGLAGGGATKVILEGCGHFPHRKQPERLVEEVARFLAWLAVVQ
jgi:pimeloyl-ACP methyl ester carboxylesterase